MTTAERDAVGELLHLLERSVTDQAKALELAERVFNGEQLSEMDRAAAGNFFPIVRDRAISTRNSLARLRATFGVGLYH